MSTPTPAAPSPASATGAGLSGGPITATGTINLTSTQLLPTVACAANQIPKWSGTAWQCQADLDTNSAGTVTSVGTGTGLTGGPITASGTIAVDTAQIQARVSGTCAVGSSIRTIAANGAVTCEAAGTGTVTSVGTGTGLTGGPITGAGTIAVDTTQIQARVTGACAVGSSIRSIAANGTVVCETDETGTGTVTSLSQGTGITLSANPITTTGSISADTDLPAAAGERDVRGGFLDPGDRRRRDGDLPDRQHRRRERLRAGWQRLRGDGGAGHDRRQRARRARQRQPGDALRAQCDQPERDRRASAQQRRRWACAARPSPAGA